MSNKDSSHTNRVSENARDVAGNGKGRGEGAPDAVVGVPLVGQGKSSSDGTQVDSNGKRKCLLIWYF